MKNLFIILIATTLICPLAKSQDGESGISLTLKIGTNYSNVYDSDGEEFNADGKFGLAAGASLGLPLGEFFGLQPEVLFSQKGFKATGVLLGGNYEFTRTTSYLDIPLFLALKPSTFVTIVAGPQFSYLLNRRDVFQNSSSTVVQEQEFENENFRKNTLCFVGGLDINLSPAVIGARVGWDLQENNGDGSSTTPRYKNVWFQTTLGFRF